MTVSIKKGSSLAALNITPLIDVVFLLLIFFLVATRFADEERKLKLNLPTASEAKPLTVQPEELIINIQASGQYYVNGVFMDADGLSKVLEEVSRNNPLSQSVIIRADHNVKIQPVVTAVNLCQQHGIVNHNLSMDDNEG